MFTLSFVISVADQGPGLVREWSQIPVVVLSVRDDEEGKVAALDAGADDYVTKPFSSAELLARLRAAHRKIRPLEEESIFAIDGLTIDLAARQVKRDGHEVKLTGTEYALLRLFITHRGRVLIQRWPDRNWFPRKIDNRSIH